jgi:hypothetical protein
MGLLIWHRPALTCRRPVQTASTIHDKLISDIMAGAEQSANHQELFFLDPSDLVVPACRAESRTAQWLGSPERPATPPRFDSPGMLISYANRPLLSC